MFGEPVRYFLRFGFSEEAAKTVVKQVVISNTHLAILQEVRLCCPENGCQ